MRPSLAVLLVAAMVIAMTATTLAQEPIPLVDHPARDYHPKWSPDGQSILFTSQRDGRISIWKMSFPDGTPVEIPTGLDGDHHISWSPDGARIAFDARGSSGWLTLWTIDATGGTPQPIRGVGTSCAQPCWSPDGLTIAYTALTGTGSGIFILSLETGVARRLATNHQEAHHPIWSADGRSLLFSSEKNGDADIWSIDVETREAVCLYQAPGRQDLVAPSPDGSRIAFIDMSVPGHALRILDLSTGEAPIWRQGSQISWPCWSPDGAWIAYVAARGSNLDIWVDVAPDVTP